MGPEGLTSSTGIADHFFRLERYDNLFMFFYFEEFLFVDYLPGDHTITGQYCTDLISKVLEAIDANEGEN